jgi:arylsulfatase A-like enzyme
VSRPNLIVIVVDRLHAGMLGAYGNSWIRSLHVDRLAGDSFVFDQAFIESPRLDLSYRAYWRGLHAAQGDRDARAGRSLPAILGAAGWHTALLSDEPEVASLPHAADFAERTLLDAPPVARSAEDASQTGLARLFDAAIAWLAAPREPFCLWIHARGMSAPWDAPLAMRNAYADEEDPVPPQIVDVPDRWLDEDYDPDELLGIVHAYCGQVSLLDACTGALVNHLQATKQIDATQVTFLSARGFSLGEHRRIGACDSALYNETVQIPWLMRFPNGLGALDRSQALVQPSDLPGTLLEWLGLDRSGLGSPAASLLALVRGESPGLRDRIYMLSTGDRAIRTPAWLLRQPADGPPELYAKPSDRWEVNEVSRLCGEVVTGLEAALVEFEQTGATGEPAPLADFLVNEVD